jgi:C4-dicarboxylate-specific signal transduction histidine kinase
MSNREAHDERILILTPTGRDGPATSAFLRKAGLDAATCELGRLVCELQSGAGAVLIAEEALLGQDTGPLMTWIAEQPPWSDLHFLVLTSDREASSVVTARARLIGGLQNATLVERPVQPLTLLSVVQSALRDRRHQYEVRAYMSERHDAEATLERLVAERTYALADSNEQLIAEMAERAGVEAALRQSQKLEAIGQLTGGVAHDFNNLLTVISSAVSLLGRPNLPDEKRKRYIDAIGDTVDRATALTGQLLAFARQQPLKAEVFNASAAVSRTAEMLRTIVGSRIDISLALADDTCFMHADKSQFETALVNMAVNAAMPWTAKGHLTIQWQRSAEYPAIRAHPGRSGRFVVVG